jgi:thiol:disulfide interchange protein DsbC
MKRLLAVASLVVAGVAGANEAQIRKALEPKLSEGSKIEGVERAPVAGLFEVRVRGAEGGLQILYSDATGSHILLGRIIDTRTERNLTEERMRRLTAIKFEQLPLDLAVKVQRGNGKHVLALFSDPYCPACRQFEQTLMRMDDITIHVFMFPVIRPELADHSRAVWCSPDRAKAWLELAAAPRAKVPEAGPNCPNPVDRVLEVGHRLGVNSTPTFFLPNGERVTGGLRLNDLKDLLNRTAAARR